MIRLSCNRHKSPRVAAANLYRLSSVKTRVDDLKRQEDIRGKHCKFIHCEGFHKQISAKNVKKKEQKAKQVFI